MINKNYNGFVVGFMIILFIAFIGMFSLARTEIFNPHSAKTDSEIRLREADYKLQQERERSAPIIAATAAAMMQTVVPMQAAATVQAIHAQATQTVLITRMEHEASETRRQEERLYWESLWNKLTLVALMLIGVVGMGIFILKLQANAAGKAKISKVRPQPLAAPATIQQLQLINAKLTKTQKALVDTTRELEMLKKAEEINCYRASELAETRQALADAERELEALKKEKEINRYRGSELAETKQALADAKRELEALKKEMAQLQLQQQHYKHHALNGVNGHSNKEYPLTLPTISSSSSPKGANKRNSLN